MCSWPVNRECARDLWCSSSSVGRSFFRSCWRRSSVQGAPTPASRTASSPSLLRSLHSSRQPLPSSGAGWSRLDLANPEPRPIADRSAVSSTRRRTFSASRRSWQRTNRRAPSTTSRSPRSSATRPSRAATRHGASAPSARTSTPWRRSTTARGTSGSRAPAPRGTRPARPPANAWPTPAMTCPRAIPGRSTRRAPRSGGARAAHARTFVSCSVASGRATGRS